MSVLSPTYYRVSALDPHAHLYEVRCTIDDPNPDGQRYRLPTWVPGSYLIRDYARYLRDLEVTGDGSPRTATKLDKATWSIETRPASATASSSVAGTNSDSQTFDRAGLRSMK